MSIRLLICDDHEVIRTGLASLLAGTDIEIVGEAANGKDALRLAQKDKPDVILLDIRMPDGDGLSAWAVYNVDLFDAARIEDLLAAYEQLLAALVADPAAPVGTASLVTAARIELGMRAFLEAGGYHAYTDTFEDLWGLAQLPGIASQRLMADGYGFGAEGDWKQAAMVRVCKVMAQGIDKGTSFMEDYTYHLDPKGPMILGAHMLEVCPSIASAKPSCEIHPLGIGGKADPVRLVFSGKSGPAMAAALVDMGNRFRIVANAVEAVEPKEALPKLPVSRILWKPLPDLKRGAAAWIYAGGGHHTAFSYTVTSEYLEDFASMTGVELVTIDGSTDVGALRRELRWNEAYYGLKGIF